MEILYLTEKLNGEKKENVYIAIMRIKEEKGEMNENFYELDKFVINYWLKHDNISLADISEHLSEESLVSGSFSKNFEKIMQRKMSFGEEFQIDVDYEVGK